jgi:hypothetical protein
MDDQEALLGTQKAQLRDFSTLFQGYKTEHDSQINQLKTTLDTVINEL